jgi:hypothetical protein
MVEEGLFKKRIRENIDVSKPLCFAMEDWVDEAKKDWDNIERHLHRRSVHKYGYNLTSEWWTKLAEEREKLRQEWFVKWFGEK